MSRVKHYMRLSVTCDRSVVFSGYSGFLHTQKTDCQRYNWNIVESGVKRHNTKSKPNNYMYNTLANYRISGVMVRMPVSSAVDRWLEPRSRKKEKTFKIGICCFSDKHAASRNKSKDWLARNRDYICASGATCLPTGCCLKVS